MSISRICVRTYTYVRTYVRMSYERILQACAVDLATRVCQPGSTPEVYNATNRGVNTSGAAMRMDEPYRAKRLNCLGTHGVRLVDTQSIGFR